MCGFVGQLGNAFLNEPLLRQMASTIIHRGPDDEGVWLDQSAGIGVAHRRLSIVDLSPEGHQPMTSHSRRYVIAFNGEIYNFRLMREALEGLGCRFHGHSDTEVFLSAIEQWGLDEALLRSVGMFAFALFDKKERTLSLVRDRMGEKPLYYGWQGSGRERVFLFGSELKALRTHPSWQGGVDRDSVAQLLRYNYIPAPQTIHPEVYKLQPGMMLQFSRVGVNSDSVTQQWKEIAHKAWWSFAERVTNARRYPFQGSKEDAVDSLDLLMKEVIQEQSLADVPVGAFLSGGIDSTSVVSLMQSLGNRPVETFTIGYDDASYDESEDAKRIADHLGTNHHQWIVTPQDAMDVIPELPSIYDEPFADASQIPTTLVSRLARQHVTVSLSGDGGDELFGGYNRHSWAPEIRKKMDRIPRPVRKGFAAGVKRVSPMAWDQLIGPVGSLFPSRFDLRQPGEKIHKIARLMNTEGERDLYGALVRIWNDPIPVNGGHSMDLVNQFESLWNEQGEFSERMMWMDSLTYLSGDILAKVDRAAMSTSLESRVPILDHRIVDFSLSLPLEMKVHCRQGKHVLRRVVDQYVPRELMERPKSGFGLPIHGWLRGPLREWAEDLLDEHRLKGEGLFDASMVRAVWNEHLQGKRSNQYLLWGVLMYQQWSRKWVEL